MNKTILAGRLTKDPEIRFSQGEKPMCIAHFTLAVNRRRTGNDPNAQNADFIRCVSFGKTAEFIEKYAKKGMKFDIVGRIQTGSYQDKNGQTVYTTEVVVEEIEFGESKKSQNDGQAQGYSQPQFQQPQQYGQQSQQEYTPQFNQDPFAGQGDFMNAPELPFA